MYNVLPRVGEEGWKWLRFLRGGMHETQERRDTGNEWRTAKSLSIPPEAKFLDLGSLVDRPTFILFLSVYFFCVILILEILLKNSNNTNTSNTFVFLVIDCPSS